MTLPIIIEGRGLIPRMAILAPRLTPFKADPQWISLILSTPGLTPIFVDPVTNERIVVKKDNFKKLIERYNDTKKLLGSTPAATVVDDVLDPKPEVVTDSYKIGDMHTIVDMVHTLPEKFVHPTDVTPPVQEVEPDPILLSEDVKETPVIEEESSEDITMIEGEPTPELPDIKEEVVDDVKVEEDEKSFEFTPKFNGSNNRNNKKKHN